MDVDSVLSCIDAPSIYEVPINLFEQEFDVKVLRRLKLPEGELHRAPLQDYVEDAAQCDGEVNIAVVGKYTSLPDAYLSVVEALHHAGVANGVTVNINLINGEELSEENVAEVLEGTDGILVPGGFGQRAFEGKIAAVRFARENGIPFLGICLGLQAAVCEFARNVIGLEGATSAEFADEGTLAQDGASSPFVIDLMPEQEDIENKGGTMRLGAYPCKVAPGTLAYDAYGSELIYERHRHRYEVCNAYRDQLVEHGMTISGLSPDGRLTEMIELPGHPWFVGTQAHPEFKSRPGKPHPLFRDFVAAAKHSS